MKKVPRVTPAQLQVRSVWSIGLYHGRQHLQLRPFEPDTPIIKAADVNDMDAAFVADPFHLYFGDLHYAFFEVWNESVGRGEIACATSKDLYEWNYASVVLREPFHLSYPCVFTTPEGVFMVPESRETQNVRLYRSERFPQSWRCVAELLRGDFADATPFRFRDLWWLFAHRGLDELRLYSAPQLHGPYTEHPASPIVAGNRRISRPAGRVVEVDGRLWRFAQDAWPNYGTCVRAIQIDRLTVSEYSEHEAARNPILNGTGSDWNALGMHHVELLHQADGSWLALVDGQTVAGVQ